MRAGGHNSFFGTDYLILVQLPAPGTIGASGLDVRLKQLDNNSLLSRGFVVNYYTILCSLFPLFFCRALTVSARKANQTAQAAAAEMVRAW